MGIAVYMVTKLNIKATGDMIFYHLNHLDINTRKLLIQYDRCPLPCTGTCEGEMANVSKQEERVKRCWVILDF